MRKPALPKSAPVAKQIRFSELVKQCGRPETVTLWTKPEDNPPFMKAVRENRVVTLLLKRHGNHPDFGEIAFHQRPNALYLVFANSLPEESGARVGFAAMSPPTSRSGSGIQANSCGRRMTAVWKCGSRLPGARN